MATVTLRPDGTGRNGGVSGVPGTSWEDQAGSAADLHTPTSDDSDATYIESDQDTDHADLALEDLALPSGAKIKQVRIRSRTLGPEGEGSGGLSNVLHQADLIRSGLSIRTWIETGAAASFEDRAGPWWITDGSGPWSDSTIDALLLRIVPNEAVSGADPLQHAELYVDVVYNEQPVGTLTGPTGTYNDDSSPDAAWSYSDPESDAQTHYRLVIEAGDTSANSAPALDGTEEYNSGETVGADTSATLPALTNGTYTVWLRVRQADVSGQQHRSEWDAIVYTLDVPPPAVPAFSATADDIKGRIILTADSISAAGEEAEEYDFQYSDDGSTWSDVRDGTEVPPDSGVDDSVATVHDYESPPNTSRFYRTRAARYDASSGERLVSSWSSSVQATAVPTNWWLKDPSDPNVNAQIRVTSLRESGDRLDVSWILFNDDDQDAWTTLWNQHTTLLLQSQETEQWYVRLVGDRAAVHTPLGRQYPVVVDDGTDPHPQLTRIRGNRAWTVSATAIIQPRP